MPWTTAGDTASAVLATPQAPRATCSSPAHNVIAQVAGHPYNWIKVAMITVWPTAGPLTWSGDPPRAPATTPPTTAAINPAATGAPEATAMPSDIGSAT